MARDRLHRVNHGIRGANKLARLSAEATPPACEEIRDIGPECGFGHRDDTGDAAGLLRLPDGRYVVAWGMGYHCFTEGHSWEGGSDVQDGIEFFDTIEEAEEFIAGVAEDSKKS